MHQKLIPHSFLILLFDLKQPLHAKTFVKVTYFERLSKNLKKFNFIFFEASPF